MKEHEHRYIVVVEKDTCR